MPKSTSLAPVHHGPPTTQPRRDASGSEEITVFTRRPPATLPDLPDSTATGLQTHFHFLWQKATGLHQLYKEIFDAVDDEELENEVTTAKDYEAKISHQRARDRCNVAVRLRSNLAALPLTTNDDKLPIT